jgi:hypothetical protein
MRAIFALSPSFALFALIHRPASWPRRKPPLSCGHVTVASSFFSLAAYVTQTIPAFRAWAATFS